MDERTFTYILIEIKSNCQLNRNTSIMDENELREISESLDNNDEFTSTSLNSILELSTEFVLLNN